MELWDAVRGRCSIRKFTPDPIPEDHLKRIIDCARLAPSGSNAQPWHFLVIRNHEVLQRMSEAISAKVREMLEWPEAKGARDKVRAIEGYSVFFAEAPVTIAVLSEPYVSSTEQLLIKRGLSFEERFQFRPCPGLQSVGAAIEHLLLAAYELGYGTCWMTGPLVAVEELERLLGVKEPWSLVGLVPLGVPAERFRHRARKSLDEVMTFVD